MKFVSSREIRNNPSAFREVLADDDVVLTAGGKPFALAIGIDEDELEDTLDLLRRVRALRAMARMQETAAASDGDELTQDRIEAEIRKVRRGRRRSA